jgi:hypothetical protein
MDMEKEYRSLKTIIPFVIISAIIFIFNIIYIWGFDGLIQDDQEYYSRLFNKSIGDLRFGRNIFHAIFTLEIIKIASLTSVFFARFLIILLLSIPSAFLIYHFSHGHYKLERYTSVAISVLPFILPNEALVPTYMVGSYMLLALLFALISIHFILRFTKRSDFSTPDFILAAATFYIATESSELIATMLPVFLFLIFIFRKLKAKQFILGSTLTFIAVRKAILIINKPHGHVNSINNDLSYSEIKHRIVHFLDYINPLHGLTNIGLLNIILISIILLGAIMVIMNHKRLRDILLPNHTIDNQKNKYFYIVYYYLFPLFWLVVSAVMFLFYTQYLTSRYFLMASVGLSFLFFTSINVIYSALSNRKVPLIIILFLIISFSGYNRQMNFKKSYQAIQDQFKSLEQTLERYDLPPDVQVIVTTSDKNGLNLGYGIFRRSNGVLQYILNRRDVKGQIMTEKCFYDPFLIYNKPWQYRYMDIDTTVNTYLFRCFDADSTQNRRLHYALRWVDDKDISSPWTIFYIGDDLRFNNFLSGKGYADYNAAMDSLSREGIHREDIMFGGIPAKSDSLRLGL